MKNRRFAAARAIANRSRLEIKGDGSGILIGRHGQTLDALEYLINRIVARRIKDAMPILLDTESYRARRRQQLHRMALSMGEKAKRDHATGEARADAAARSPHRASRAQGRSDDHHALGRRRLPALGRDRAGGAPARTPRRRARQSARSGSRPRARTSLASEQRERRITIGSIADWRAGRFQARPKALVLTRPARGASHFNSRSRNESVRDQASSEASAS